MTQLSPAGQFPTPIAAQIVMPGGHASRAGKLAGGAGMSGSHALKKKVADGRDKPGHDTSGSGEATP